jgi:SAM-dependent methyltransferase
VRPDETSVTRRAYDATAARYHARWKDTDPLASTRQRFRALLPAGATVLDVGCGTGRDLASFGRAGFTTVGLDRSEAMLRAAGMTSGAVLADVRRIPLAAAFVDCWWASASLLHLPRHELPGALEELRRVSRGFALGFLSVKEGVGEVFEPVDGSQHHRFFCFWEADDLDAVIASAGWTVEHAWTSPDTIGRRAWISRLVRLSG